MTIVQFSHRPASVWFTSWKLTHARHNTGWELFCLIYEITRNRLLIVSLAHVAYRPLSSLIYELRDYFQSWNLHRRYNTWSDLHCVNVGTRNRWPLPFVWLCDECLIQFTTIKNHFRQHVWYNIVLLVFAWLMSWRHTLSTITRLSWFLIIRLLE